MAADVQSELLRAGLAGEAIFPGDARYDAARRVWNGMADRRPAAIVRAASATDAARTVAVAAATGSLLAVRCGGHSLPGLSTCDGGIVLDLSPINGIAVDPSRQVAEVGGGALLGDLDRAGEPHGLVTPAGVISHTGVGGLTLGGGMGWLSRRFGLTVDSLLGVELVTADGGIRTVTAETEPELFWGLRGGGGNFGVVTRFTFRMHGIGRFLAGSWLYGVADAGQVLAALDRQAAAAPRQLTASFSMSPAGLSVSACWSGPGDAAEAAVAAFGKLAAPSAAVPHPQSWTGWQSRHDDVMRWGRRYYSRGGFLAGIGAPVIDSIREAIATAPTESSDIYVLQLGGAVADVAEDATAYSGRRAAFYWIVSPVWDDPADDARCLAWGRQWSRRMADLSEAGNYVNEQGDASNDIARAAYGAEKYQRLAALKARLDPGNLFRLNQNIEPRNG